MGISTVTKKDLLDQICKKTGQSRAKVKDTLQFFLDAIIEELGKGNRLEFREFGVFEVKVRAARTAQNPKTLQPVRVPAKRTVKFKVGRKMREHLAQVSQREVEASPPSPNGEHAPEVKVMPVGKAATAGGAGGAGGGDGGGDGTA